MLFFKFHLGCPVAKLNPAWFTPKPRETAMSGVESETQGAQAPHFLRSPYEDPFLRHPAWLRARLQRLDDETVLPREVSGI